MRLTASISLILLGVACKSSLGAAPIPRLQPDDLHGAPGTITVISARVDNECGAPANDLVAPFRQACDGKWRCAVRAARSLSAKHEAIGKTAREPADPRCDRYTVDWICGKGTGKRSLMAGTGSRFRLSCPSPDAQSDEPSDGVAGQTGAQPAAAPLVASRSSRDLAVHGRFVGTAATGVADRKIVVGSQRTSTDQAGAFSLSNVPASYDLSVLDQDGSQVSLFLGLSRRDPVVAHSEWQGGQRDGLPARGAYINGRLGGATIPKDEGRLRATLQFFTAVKPTHRSNAGLGVTSNYPGDMNRSPISWSGPPTISGQLLATIRSVETKDHDNALVGIASKRLTLEDGDSASEDLTVINLSSGHIAGTWYPAENPLATSIAVSFEMSDGSGEFWVGSCRLRNAMGGVVLSGHVPSTALDPERLRPFDCPLPDVGFLPGRYAVLLVERYGSILEPEREHLATCGIQMGGTDLVMPCNPPTQAVPKTTTVATTVQFTSPAHGQFTTITSGSRFDWESQDNAVYAIELLPHTPFNLVPKISLFTSKSSFRWTDLTAHGIGFPTGAAYTAMVTSIPVSSVDEVASPDWWYSREPDSKQPEHMPSGVKLIDPTAPPLDPHAPSNVKDLKDFPSGLPVCPSEMKGQVLGSHSFGRMVTITGNLTRGSGLCLDAGGGGHCSSHWAITGVAGSSLPVSLERDGGNTSPIPVAATGRLVFAPFNGGPLLEQANLCLIRKKP